MIKIKSTIFYGQDPRSIRIDNQDVQDIPLHYMFEYSGQFIHLVIFYERNRNYLWHGKVQDNLPKIKRGSPRLPCMENINLSNLKFGGVYAGAYDK